jgi:hypothetical protein
MVYTVGVMGQLERLPGNFFSKVDQARLESFAGHEIAHGRATRWRWRQTDAGESFALLGDGADLCIAAVVRDRAAGCFRAYDGERRELANGDLAHVMAALEHYLTARHGEPPQGSA